MSNLKTKGKPPPKNKEPLKTNLSPAKNPNPNQSLNNEKSQALCPAVNHPRKITI